MSEFKYHPSYSHLTKICLNLTDACNLACRYCFVEQNPHFITLNIAKDAVYYLVNNYNWKKEHNCLQGKNDKIHLTYFGGEPTLLWDEIIEPLTLWIEQKYPEMFIFGITTNGTLLNENRIQFLKEHQINPLLSIDGAKITQDYNRPCRDNKKSSFDAVYKNIPLLLKAFPDITFRSTIDENTVSHTFENYLFAEQCGFKNIFMMPNVRQDWSSKNIEIFKEEFRKIYWYMANCFMNNKLPMHFTSQNDLYKSILKQDLMIKNHNLPDINKHSILRCGLGTSHGSIGYDGKIYGCQEQDSKYNENNLFYIGDIYSGIDEEKHSKLLQAIRSNKPVYCKNIDRCENCCLRYICDYHYCPSTNYDITNDVLCNPEMYCIWRTEMFKNACVIMRYLTAQDNQTFKNYLKKYCNYNYK